MVMKGSLEVISFGSFPESNAKKSMPTATTYTFYKDVTISATINHRLHWMRLPISQKSPGIKPTCCLVFKSDYAFFSFA
nr:hypothetical protein Iba_chr14fCG0720 [Ipomoea batatas]